MIRFIRSRSIIFDGASTSTQHPWHRKLHELMIEMNKNGGKCSPLFSRFLYFCTERIPLYPKLNASFQRSRLSVSVIMRLANLNIIVQDSFLVVTQQNALFKNSKYEIRNSKQIRSSKFQYGNGPFIATLDLRISSLIRHSNFVIRIFP